MTGESIKTRADYWRFYAGESTRGGSPLYARLSLAIADDDAMQDFAALAKPGQPHANILFGAVHFVLLGGVEHPLRLYYPHLRRAGETEPADDPYPAFKDFVAAHEAALRAIMPVCVTNTNEVRRCTMLYPSFTAIARAVKSPLALIEIGPSAGLNLNFDRYQYLYSAPGSAETACGDLSSALVLPCEARGGTRPPLDPRAPAIARRVGLELNPVDVASEADRRWLKALIWPGPIERMARIEAALKIAQAHPPRIVPGDAVGNLAAAIAETPIGAHATVFHSFVTYQFPTALRETLDATFAALSVERTLSRLAIEWDGKDYPIVHTVYRGGKADARTLALCDPHGAWLEWKAS